MEDGSAKMLSRQERLQSFVDGCVQHITGDEKGEAQIFLDRFLQAFHQKGVKEVGGVLEERIKKAAEDGGGVSFADFVWKPLVLIEMKNRGADLARHYPPASPRFRAVNRVESPVGGHGSRRRAILCPHGRGRRRDRPSLHP